MNDPLFLNFDQWCIDLFEHLNKICPGEYDAFIDVDKLSKAYQNGEKPEGYANFIAFEVISARPIEKIFAPFTNEQVKKLEAWQSGFIENPESPCFIEKDGVRIQGDPTHPYTCCTPDYCERKGQQLDNSLIPTTEGWVCPCGKYTQNWCNDYMVE